MTKTRTTTHVSTRTVHLTRTLVATVQVQDSGLSPGQQACIGISTTMAALLLVALGALGVIIWLLRRNGSKDPVALRALGGSDAGGDGD